MTASEADDQPQLFLIPAAGPLAQANFERTVLELRHADQLPADVPFDADTPLWGTDERNEVEFQAMQPGDVLAFYTGDFTYSRVARIQETCVGAAIAEQVWDHNDGSRSTWPYLIVLDAVTETALDSRQLHDDLGYDSDWPQGITRVRDRYVANLRDHAGSLDAYLSQTGGAWQ